MRPHKKTLLAAACATGLLLGLEGCGLLISPAEFPNDECEELTNGGVLNCEDNKGARCKLALNECTYYRLGKYRILVDLGSYGGAVYYRPYTVENYDGHSPGRREIESDISTSSAGPGFIYPSAIPDLFGAVHLKVSIFDTEERKWKYSEFSMYRAWVSPEVTYESTVWGKLRKQGDTTYAWHVLPRDKYLDYIELSYDFEGDGRGIRNWSPEKSIEWRAGEKGAQDELAKHMSLSFPLADGWEAYDLNFIFGEIYHWQGGTYESHGETYPKHLRRSFTEVDYDTTRGFYDATRGFDLVTGFLEFKVRKR